MQHWRANRQGGIDAFLYGVPEITGPARKAGQPFLTASGFAAGCGNLRNGQTMRLSRVPEGCDAKFIRGGVLNGGKACFPCCAKPFFKRQFCEQVTKMGAETGHGKLL